MLGNVKYSCRNRWMPWWNQYYTMQYFKKNINASGCIYKELNFPVEDPPPKIFPCITPTSLSTMEHCSPHYALIWPTEIFSARSIFGQSHPWYYTPCYIAHSVFTKDTGFLLVVLFFFKLSCILGEISGQPGENFDSFFAVKYRNVTFSINHYLKYLKSTI